MKKVIGLDFGTTNTVVAISDGDTTTPLTFSDGGIQSNSIPTVLLFERGLGQILIGEDATRAYMEDPDSGRYLRSIKSTLSSRTFNHTIIGGKSMSAEDLVYTFLHLLRRRIVDEVGIDITRVVLGHPVKFSNDLEMHQVARDRLAKAATRAGFDSILLCEEPVGALYAYANQLHITKPQTVVICDIGGGTSDFTLAKVAPSGTINVIGVGGTRLGGDDFDSVIMWEKLAHLFGRGSNYKSMFGKVMPIPPSVIYPLQRAHLIPLLRDRKTLDTIIDISRHSDNPRAIERLMTLIQGNYGLQLFRTIEQAKKDLTRSTSAILRFDEDDLDINITLTRDEFDVLTSPIVEGIIGELTKFLDTNNTTPSEITNVFVTGGTSHVLAFQRRLRDVFSDPDKIVIGDPFTSVAYGLATYGAQNS